jgi:hypothetical protein
MVKSTFLSLNAKDFIKSLIMAFITALVTGIYQLFQSGSAFNWVTIKPVLFVAIGAMFSYLLKNYLTNSGDQLLTPEKK